MKTLILLSLFLISGFSTKAQEKQSDATLEETISWINNYGLELAEKLKKNTYEDITYDSSRKVIQLALKDDATGEFEFIGVELNNMNSLESHFWDEKYVIRIYLDDQSYSSGSMVFGYIHLQFSNKVSAQKVFKAFEHFFYLTEHKLKVKNIFSLEDKF